MAECPSRSIRLALDQRSAQAVHAALTETLHGNLLEGDRRDAAREVLEQLDRSVPDWLDTAPVGGEAGYLIAAESVLRALVAAEDGAYSRCSLAESELLRELGDAKPLGATANDVLERMLREKLIARRRGPGDDERWWAAAAAGRQFLHRNTAADDASWAVHDALELLDLIYADSRGHGTAFLPWVQAIGRLDDEDLAPLLAALSADGLLRPPDDDRLGPALDGVEQRRELESRRERRRLRAELSLTGYELARTRWRDTAPGRFSFGLPTRPPLPYRRDLPIRGLTVQDRQHPQDPYYGHRYCPPASWLQRSSKTKLWATFKRDGVVEWRCQTCSHTWLVYLQATTREGRPAYRDPAAAAYNVVSWRPAGW
jgi:hypothetical protein